MVTLSGIRADNFFNLKGLNPAAVTRLEKSIKTSRETLALADKLQVARDTIKTLQKTGTSISSRVLDLYS